MSRMKQATQMPMFGGLPQLVIRAAITPKVSPARMLHVLGDQNRLKVALFSHLMHFVELVFFVNII